METIKKIILAVLLFVPALLFAETVNINTADKESLMAAIQGVGEKRAEAIIAYREENGPFKSVEELSEVKGIGSATIESSYENLTVIDQ
ncbi:MAG: helix-hairpin-helix domain-containing protein [Proteobacteria bacterium]|nr:helix-hairpin-helix domain-containing protein [Pseudomonadota bacterium]